MRRPVVPGQRLLHRRYLRGDVQPLAGLIGAEWLKEDHIPKLETWPRRSPSARRSRRCGSGILGIGLKRKPVIPAERSEGPDPACKLRPGSRPCALLRSAPAGMTSEFLPYSRPSNRRPTWAPPDGSSSPARGLAVLGALGYRAWDRGVFAVGEGEVFKPWEDWARQCGRRRQAAAACRDPRRQSA